MLKSDWCLLAVVSLFCFPVWARQNSLPAARKSKGAIQVDVVVSGRDGKPVAGLHRVDFRLLDDKHLTPIAGFQAWGGSKPLPPTQIILAIDAVNISFMRLALSRAAVGQFLRENGGDLVHPVSILWLTDEGIVPQGPPSKDGNAVAAALDATESRLRMLNREAGDWGAIERFEMSLQMLDQIVQRQQGQPGRKLLIWVGPGWPMLDSPEMEQTWKEQESLFQSIVALTTDMRLEQIVLSSVSTDIDDIDANFYEAFLGGVKSPNDTYLPDLALKALAVKSGGRVEGPSNDLKSEIDACVQDAEAFYTLSFRPPPVERPAEYHDIKVEVEGPGTPKGKLSGRTVTGYYYTPPQ